MTPTTTPTTTPTKATTMTTKILPAPPSCFVCNTPMGLVRDLTEMSVGSRSAIIEVEQFRCPSCGEDVLTPEQMDSAQRTLAGTLRSQERLLSPEAIRAIRTKYALTQAQLEQLLRVGPKTVVRWERGTVFQNRATDELLRLLDAVPEAFEFLARKNGVSAAIQKCEFPSVEKVMYALPAEQAKREPVSDVAWVSEDRGLPRSSHRPREIKTEIPTRDAPYQSIPKEALR